MSSMGSRWVLWAVCAASSLLAACGGADSGVESGIRESATVVSVAQLQTQNATQPRTQTPVLTQPQPPAQAQIQPPVSDAPAAPAAPALAATTTKPVETGSAKSPPTSVCGTADIGGWTIPTPVKADPARPLRDLQQPGSRIHYVSSATGDDRTAQFYLWNGSQIIDGSGSPVDANGRAYGTDPMNPSSAVKAFKRWAAVGLSTSGKSTASPSELNSALEPATRKGFPDWWLFKRGNSFDLLQDLKSVSTDWRLSLDRGVYASLGVSGGRSPDAVQVVGAYGDICLPRPRFIHPHMSFVRSYEQVFANVAYLSLHFDGHDRSVESLDWTGVKLRYQTKASSNILLEDIWFDATSIQISEKNSSSVKVRRSLITDNFNTDGDHKQGIYYYGEPDGVLQIEESILLRNGFTRGDPTVVWPPSGAQVWDIFSRNLYISGKTDRMKTSFVDSVSMMGASGDQFRPGARVERNFFYQGYVTMGASGGYADSEGPSGTILDNVLQRLVGTGTDDNRGQPGWGFGLTSGAHRVEVRGNIVTGVQHPGTLSAFTLAALGWACRPDTFRYATRDNLIRDNIFDSPRKVAAVQVSDGPQDEKSPGCSNWQYPGVHSNVVENNILIGESGRESQYNPVGPAIGLPNDTIFRGNRMFATREAAALALGWSSPHRTLKTYLESIGVPVESPDGFMEYYRNAVQLRRGQWRADLMSKSILNHFRAGFGQRALQ